MGSTKNGRFYLLLSPISWVVFLDTDSKINHQINPTYPHFHQTYPHLQSPAKTNPQPKIIHTSTLIDPPLPLPILKTLPILYQNNITQIQKRAEQPTKP